MKKQIRTTVFNSNKMLRWTKLLTKKAPITYFLMQNKSQIKSKLKRKKNPRKKQTLLVKHLK